METGNIQVRFFQHIKSLVPPHIALVDEIAGLLSISTDSAYRRIRGEKPISIDEAALLAAHFKLSMDQFLHLQTDSFVFSGKLANASDHVFEKWMEDALKQLQYMNSFRKKHMTYLAKDIPLFAQFLVPEVTAFKSFLWRKSILHYSELKGIKFSLDNIEEKHIDLGNKMAEVYNQIPATDIWNVESINSTIRQVEYYRDAGVFEKESDVTRLYDAIIRLIDHLEKQAELGVKFAVGGTPKANAAAFHMYNNELILGDNTVCVELDDKKITYLTHSAINYVYTTDERFNEHMYNALQNIIRKSSHLSEVGEKERVRFFNKIRNKITSVSL
jgi:plasmid maintenance system antidote protein VapI